MADDEVGLGMWEFAQRRTEVADPMASRVSCMQPSNAHTAGVAEARASQMALRLANCPDAAVGVRWHCGVQNMHSTRRSMSHGMSHGMVVGHGGARRPLAMTGAADNAPFPSDNSLSFYPHPPQPPFIMANNDAASSPAAYNSSVAASPAGSPSAASASSAGPDAGRARYNGRQLVPGIPAPAPVPQAVTTLSPAASHGGPLQHGGGPLSKHHIVPPRPKPGRKPATEEPESKRKAQNRLSQRNFRQRKQKTVEELQERLAQREAEIRNLKVEHARELDFMEHKIRDLQNKAEQWKTQCFNLQQKWNEGHDRVPLNLNHMQRQDTPLRKPFDDALDANLPLQSAHDMDVGCGRCTKEHCACFAEMTNDAAYQDDAMTGILRGGHAESDDEKPIDPLELETDFTLAFRKPNPAEFLSSTEDKPDCGFCTGRPDLCLCKGAGTEVDNEPTSIARVATASSPEKKLNTAMTGPGSCADCQANPQQRAWCQRVAQLRSEATPPNSRRNSSKSNTLETMEPKVSTSIDMSNSTPSPAASGRTIGCSEAFKLLDGRVDTEMDWRQLKPVPQTFAQQDARKDTFTMEPGMYSAMELDASSILTTLQHAQRPLRLRESDGTFARLVQDAEERRRASFSPMTKPNDHGMLEAVTQYSALN